MFKSSLILAVSLVLAAGPVHASGFEVRPLADVLKQAGQEGKLAFVDFYANWCDPCKQVAATVFPDPKVHAWLEQYTVPVAIDGERGEGPQFHDRYKLKFYPTMLLLKPDGTELGRYTGSLGVDEFLQTFEQLRTGTDRLAALRKKVEADPKDADARFHLALLEQEQDKKDEAKTQLRALIDLDTAWAGSAASELLGDDDKDEALKKAIDARADALLKAALKGKASPGQIAAVIGLLDARERTADLIKLDVALQSATLEPKTRFNLAAAVSDALMKENKNAEAATLLQSAVQKLEAGGAGADATAEDRYVLQKRISYLYGQIFKALLLSGKPDEARELAEHSLSLDADVNNYNRLSWAAFEAEKSNDYTLALARKGNELAQGEDLNMADTLANVLQQMGKSDEALAVIDAAMKTTNLDKRLKAFQKLRDSITNPKKDEDKKS